MCSGEKWIVAASQRAVHTRKYRIVACALRASVYSCACLATSAGKQERVAAGRLFTEEEVRFRSNESLRRTSNDFVRISSTGIYGDIVPWWKWTTWESGTGVGEVGIVEEFGENELLWRLGRRPLVYRNVEQLQEFLRRTSLSTLQIARGIRNIGAIAIGISSLF